MFPARLFLLALIGISFFSSCGPEIVYEKELAINTSGWTYGDTLHYDFDIADTNKLYNLFLDLEHTTDFSTQNLYVKIYTGFPNGQRLSQVLSIDIANKLGQWLGECSGNICHLDIPIQRNAYFNQLGMHTFTLEQYMRTEALSDLQGASFRVEVSDLKRE